MNNKPNPDRSLLHFMLRAQQIAQQDGRSDKGYAMMLVSLVSIAMFSMLAAYTTMTNLSKSSTKAYVDGTNTFYVAESGLNRRAAEIREKFLGYATPTGNSPGQTTTAPFVSAANMPNCFPLVTTPATANDFECRNYAYNSTKNTTTLKSLNNNKSFGGSNQTIDNLGQTNYIAYTFVADKTIYNAGAPQAIVIPAGQQYAGLSAQLYRYTVYATAAKPDPLNPTNPVQQSDAKTVLQMDFKSQIVPLFQFAVFYDGDLEMNSSSDMTIGGLVHINGNFYVQPNQNDPTISTTFLSPITTVGRIFNRVDSTGYVTGAITKILLTGTSCTPATNCKDFPPFGASTVDLSRSATDPLSAIELAGYAGKIKDGTAGTQHLETPPPGFLRKRNYFLSKTTSNVGEYYAKADMRLEMVPDRDVISTTGTPWTRDLTMIPFNFTSITSVFGTAGSCTSVLPPLDSLSGSIPSATSDPAANYIASDRNNATNLHCNVFSKGQLQSLRQPVLVLTSLNQPNAALQTLPAAVPTPTSESGILGRPVLPPIPAGLSVAVTDPITGIPARRSILRALQVALASTPSPVALDTLNKPFSDTSAIAAYAAIPLPSPGSIFRTEFNRLINSVPVATLPAADKLILTTTNTITPNQIAAIGNAWFLPAPIQRIETNNTVWNGAPADAGNLNVRSSGFYDGRERRWITMLQTNIASLSVWNRDGLYVEATLAANGGGTTSPDAVLTTPYQTNNDMKDASFNLGVGARFTDGLAFDRASTIPATPKGLQSLGLGSMDTTEGGLVFHATVSDDLNGDGTTAVASDVSLDTAAPILKKNPDGSNYIDPITLTTVTIDYPRKYRNGANYSSPFGFAFNGGDYLPGSLTLVTDQAIYVQGNFNNNNGSQPTTTAAIPANPPDSNRLPASIIGDTITVLSNECMSGDSTITNITAAPATAIATTPPTATLPRRNELLVPAGQISCGIPRNVNGSVNLISGNFYRVVNPDIVNAAFLSNTDRSIGNLPDVPVNSAGDRGYNAPATNKRFSGALNNYMHMLEDWAPVLPRRFFNYTGSFISLGTPLEYSGRYFSSGNYYNIPSRNFNFDTKFNTFGSLPPLPPRAILLKQDVFKRNYN